MDDAIEIVQASREDAAAASDILREAAAWLEERGIPLWDREQLTPEHLLPIIERGEFYLACRAGQPVGTMILQEDDTFFWPDVPAGE